VNHCLNYTIMKSSHKLLLILLLSALTLAAYGCMDQTHQSDSATAGDASSNGQSTTTGEYHSSSMDESHLNGNAPGLAIQMKYIQHWTHKLGLSVEANNTELVEFYHHELEEGAADLMATIKEYDGFPIAALVESMLIPQIHAFESAEESGDWDQIRTAYSAIITSCNTCHVATDHGYIVINEGFGNNPFNQDFGTK